MLHTPSGEAGLEQDRTLSQIARGLTWIGGAFLVASAAVIVWAVFRTVGVDDLIVALTVAGLGLGLPAIVAFVVAWILNSLGHTMRKPRTRKPSEPAAAPRRMQVDRSRLGYGVAVLACVAAWALRAVARSAARRTGRVCAVAAVGRVRRLVRRTRARGASRRCSAAQSRGTRISSPTERFGTLDIQDSVQLGLYCAAALCIGGIASALRASRERAQTLVREVLAREAGLEKTRAELAAERDRSQVTLQAIADAVVATDAQGSVTFVNDCAVGADRLAGARGARQAARQDFPDARWKDSPQGRSSHSSAARRMPRWNRFLPRATERNGVVEFKVSAMRDRAGAAGGFVLVFRDITAGAARACCAGGKRSAVPRAGGPDAGIAVDVRRRARVRLRQSLVARIHRAHDRAGSGRRLDRWHSSGGFRSAAGGVRGCVREAACLHARISAASPRRRVRWILDNGAPRFDGDGRFAGYIGACVDITERKAAEATIGNFEQRKSAISRVARARAAQSARTDPQLDRVAAAHARKRGSACRARARDHRAAMRAPCRAGRRLARSVADRQRQHPVEARARRRRFRSSSAPLLAMRQ